MLRTWSRAGLGLDPKSSTLADYLDTDDQVSFKEIEPATIEDTCSSALLVDS
jgi:hypothetical protein